MSTPDQGRWKPTVTSQICLILIEMCQIIAREQSNPATICANDLNVGDNIISLRRLFWHLQTIIEKCALWSETWSCKWRQTLCLSTLHASTPPPLWSKLVIDGCIQFLLRHQTTTAIKFDLRLCGMRIRLAVSRNPSAVGMSGQHRLLSRSRRYWISLRPSDYVYVRICVPFRKFYHAYISSNIW